LEGRVAESPKTDADADKPAPAAPIVDPYASWVELNRAALIVNEELLTWRDIQRGVVRRIRAQKRQNPDQQRLLEEEIVDRARVMLQIQGGKDLGFDPELVDRMVTKYLERQTELAGGVTRLAEGLKREDKDSFVRKDEVYSYVYSKLWTESATGETPGPGGRIMRDRYVRPGRALFEYREELKNLPKTRTAVITQLLILLGKPPAPGAEERAVARLEDLRARVENGEDMGALAEQYGSTIKGTRGLSEPPLLVGLRSTNPRIADFLDQAKVGELSPVLPFIERGVQTGFIVVRPEEYKVDTIADFNTPEGQLKRMVSDLERLDKRRIQVGLAQLLAAAYVWPPEAFPSANPER
jgi:hypothetical protein